ncbi:MAG: serine--tRNA ligase [Clostridia bacterium]|nr:serine--tRNA ligase [Clostridia bacterium]MDD4375899.1 serine--tRNA ligase [Clostridia bacterium]
MLDIKFIRDNVDLVKKATKDKLFNVDIDKLLLIDNDLKALTKQLDDLKEERNKISSSIPSLSGDEKNLKIMYVKELKVKIADLESSYQPLKEDFDNLMLMVPNPTLPEVPVGKNEEDNVEIRTWGEIRKFDFTPKDHVELGLELDLMDFAHAAKIAGARTYYLKNDAMLLEMAICRYVLDKLDKKGFTPMSVPVMVKDIAMKGTGYFPLGKEQAYEITEDGLYLVGTSEVSLVSYHNGELLNKNDLPIMYAGYSNCFRREAGTYGKDTKGLYRVHQFTKIEQVIICEADSDVQYKLHDFLLNNAEEIMQELKLPYRVVEVCTGDIGIGQIRKHDIEAWMPSRKSYSETHSCSSFNDFQSRRSNIRYKDDDSNTKYVYTLNNTAVASPRILIPILENYQNSDGTITIPEVLVPYMGGKTKIEPRIRS